MLHRNESCGEVTLERRISRAEMEAKRDSVNFALCCCLGGTKEDQVMLFPHKEDLSDYLLIR
jgi:hypothetical protein